MASRTAAWRAGSCTATLPAEAAEGSDSGKGSREPWLASGGSMEEGLDQARQADGVASLGALTAQPSCLAVRAGAGIEAEKGSGTVALVGLVDGMVMLVDPARHRVLAQWNKDRVNAGGRCADIAWAPTDPSQFAAAFSGAVLIFSLDRNKEENLGGAGRPPVAEPRITISEPKTSKHNPRQRWTVGSGPVHALRYAPAGAEQAAGLLAVASGDGALRVVDTATSLPVVTFTSYFGGVRCIDWSADGRYLLAGGEDDCVTVWSLEEQRQVARCSGHSSWVTAVRFIPPSTESAEYCFASAGWDGRACLWRFEPTVQGRPAPSAPSGEGGDAKAAVVAACAEGDRSVARLSSFAMSAPHPKPLSSLAVTPELLAVGCDGASSARPLPAGGCACANLWPCAGQVRRSACGGSGLRRSRKPLRTATEGRLRPRAFRRWLRLGQSCRRRSGRGHAAHIWPLSPPPPAPRQCIFLFISALFLFAISHAVLLSLTSERTHADAAMPCASDSCSQEAPLTVFYL